MSLIANPYDVLDSLQIVIVHLFLTLGLGHFLQLPNPVLGIVWYFKFRPCVVSIYYPLWMVWEMMSMSWSRNVFPHSQ